MTHSDLHLTRCGWRTEKEEGWDWKEGHQVEVDYVDQARDEDPVNQDSEVRRQVEGDHGSRINKTQ